MKPKQTQDWVSNNKADLDIVKQWKIRIIGFKNEFDNMTYQLINTLYATIADDIRPISIF